MKTLREAACAKINLFLHVTGRRPDGYHLLDSLVGFASVADGLAATPADSITLSITGPYATTLSSHDNSVLKAAHALARFAAVKQGAALTLQKNLPVAAGIGGGSADAAATLRLLMRLWNIVPDAQALDAIALGLGADVPVCLRSKSLYVSGIGEALETGPAFAGMPVVLVNPGKPLATADVFAGVAPPFSTPARRPVEFASFSACVQFLAKCRNDLEMPAMQRLPEIAKVKELLSTQEGCGLARMSGSGATCFGLFEQAELANKAAAALVAAEPGWWVQATQLM